MPPSYQRAAFYVLLLFSVLSLQSTALSQWRKLTNASTGFFNEVFFFDNQHGWITSFDGTILRTADGGTSWQSSSLPNAKSSPNRDICFVSSSTGFVSGDDGIWKSTNAGASWTNISPSSPVIAGSTSCWFIDANNGVLGFGNCADTTVTFCATTDGGASWSSVSYSHTTPDVAVGGIGYTNGSFYAAGGNGKHWKSTDGGISWSYLPTGSGGWQEDLVTSGGNIFAASANGTSCAAIGGGKIMKSANGGTSWTAASFPSIVMWGITMYSGTDGWACGDNGNAFKTTDGGSTWTKTSCGMASADRIDDIHFTDATHGWAVGDGIYQFVPHYYIPLRDTIDFGDALIGTKRGDSLIPVKSIGSAGSIQSWRTIGADSANFNLPSNIVPIPLSSCGSAGVLCSFQPKNEGVKIAKVELTLLDGGAPITVVVKGRGVRPRIAAPTTHKADTMACNYRRYDTIPVHNLGSYPLQVDSAWFSDMRAGAFSIVRPPPPFTVPIGSVVSVIVQTDMNVPGQFGATLQLRNNDPDPNASPHQVVMSGYRRKLTYELDPDTVVTIPSAPLRTGSTVCVRLGNIGDGFQIVESVKPLNGSSAITLKNTVVNLQLPQNEYTTLCFDARATDTLRHERRFWIRMQPCSRDTFVVVKFQATNPYANAPRERALQLATCGEIATDSIVVRNTGNSTLLLHSARFNSPASSFAIETPTAWPASVAPHDSVVIIYQITPTKAKQQDTLTLQSNDSTLVNGLLKIPCSATFSTPQAVATVVKPMASSVCVSADTLWQVVAVKNLGNVAVNILELIQLSGNQLPFAVAIPHTTIPAGKTDTVMIGLVGLRAGNFTEKFAVRFAECDLTDSISLDITVVESSVAWVQKDISLGTTPLGETTSGTIVIANNGNSDVTVDSLYLTGSKFQIQGITLPLLLRAGEKRVISVQFVGDSTAGELTAGVVAITGSPCHQIITGQVSVKVTSQEIVLSTNRISFGSLLPCAIPTAVDSVAVRNVGTTVVRITQANFAIPTSGFQLLNSPLPRDLAPGERVTLLVGVQPGSDGPLTNRLVVLTEPPLQTQLSTELTATREAVGAAVSDPNGNALTELSFVGVAPCRTSISKQLVLRNRGTVADTFTITSTSTKFTVVPTGTFILQAGKEQTVQVDADLTSTSPNQSLVIRSANCSNETRIPLTASLRSVAIDHPDSIQEIAVVGTSSQHDLLLLNPSSDSVLVAEAMLQHGDVFTLLFAGQQRIAPDERLAIPIRFAPDSIGVFSDTLRLILAEPCPDTLVVHLFGDGRSDRMDTVAISIAGGIGRWGETVETPLLATNNSNRTVMIGQLAVQANARLLKPTKLTVRLPQEPLPSPQPTIQIDPANASVLVHQLSIPSSSSSGDTIATITWEVLRGDSVASAISIWGIPDDSRAVVAATGGNFLLENYCDAHGRLLRATGMLALKQNIPNPFNQTTVIEFEVPFSGETTLTVTDLLGNTLLQPVRGQQTAGRQQITIDASSLPPGVYRYTLQAGLGTLSRWMIVAR